MLLKGHLIGFILDPGDMNFMRNHYNWNIDSFSLWLYKHPNAVFDMNMIWSQNNRQWLLYIFFIL